MLCKNCNLKEICKTYDFIKKVDHANIVINDCKYNKYQSSELDKTIKNISNSTNAENRKQTSKSIPSFELDEEFNKKRQERIFSVNNISEPKKKSKYISCSNCGATTVEDDIKLCSQCNKRICSACGTISNGKIYCDDCWGTKNSETEKIIKEVDKLDENATENQIKSAKLKDSLLNDSVKTDVITVKALIPKVSETEKNDLDSADKIKNKPEKNSKKNNSKKTAKTSSKTKETF